MSGPELRHARPHGRGARAADRRVPPPGARPPSPTVASTTNRRTNSRKHQHAQHQSTQVPLRRACASAETRVCGPQDEKGQRHRYLKLYSKYPMLEVLATCLGAPYAMSGT
eukprot:1204821-Rhodomonas_salina.1